MNASRDWLVPIGDTGIYVTPNEPVDPWDCARWSGSPICSDPVGFNPEYGFSPATGITVMPESLAPEIFGISTADLVTLSPISLDIPAYESNDCETCLTFGGTFWFIPIPQYTTCYRRPECRPIPLPPPPPLPPPGMPGFFPVNYDHNPACLYEVFVRLPSYLIGDSLELVWDVNSKGILQGQVTGLEVVVASEIEIFDYNAGGNFSAPLSNIGMGSYIQTNLLFFVVSSSYSGVITRRLVAGTQTPELRFEYGEPVLAPVPNVEIAAVVPLSREQVERSHFSFIDRDVYENYCTVPAPSPPPIHDPPERCCMPCCDNNNESEELLRKIAKRIGVDAYPVVVPQNLMQGDRNQSIESITELAVWQILQLDGLIGQFPVDIKIKDADLTQPGNQEKTIRLYNIAEAFAELYAVSVKTSVMGDAQTQMLARLAAEAVTTHAGVAVTQDYAKAIASYLGFASNTPPRKLKFAFDLTEPDSLDKLMTTVTKEIVGFEDTDKNTVQDYLEKLMFAAGIIKAVYYRKGSQVPELLKQMQSIFETGGSGAEQEAWENFLEQLNQVAPGGRTQIPAPQVRDRTAGQED